jgi:hypothetical protein
MKSSALLVLILLAACVSVPADERNKVDITAHHISRTCDPADLNDAVALHIMNKSSDSVALPVKNSAGPPALASDWTSILVKRHGSADFDPWGVIGGHPESPTQLQLHPGESIGFSISIAPWKVSDASSIFVVAIPDYANDRVYWSEPFALCASRSVPNNSFKGKPLRGSP